MKVIYKWLIFSISVFALSSTTLASSSSVNTGSNNNSGNGGAAVNIFIEKLSPEPTHTRTRSFGR